jgi:hypothetical protein
VRLAARTAVDAAVKHVAETKKPIDAKVVVDVMNLLTSRNHVRDLHNLRLSCKLTFVIASRCRAIPCSNYPRAWWKSSWGEAGREKCPSAVYARPSHCMMMCHCSCIGAVAVLLPWLVLYQLQGSKRTYASEIIISRP